ncbi:MAG TPA: DUF1844 domain-containing protein [Nitrospiraceae bacterium]|nr:DUF1844 domain-containing protein [Nitrospiraceae bacterium]
MSEEEQGFVIRDRRGRGEPADRGGTEASPSPASKAAEAPAPDLGQDTHIPANFSSFVISMGSSALMLMGEQLNPQQPSLPVNLPQAKEIIDLLSMLEEKTRGNLTSDEQGVLEDMLYALRMKFVSLSSGQPARTP